MTCASVAGRHAKALVAAQGCAGQQLVAFRHSMAGIRTSPGGAHGRRYQANSPLNAISATCVQGDVQA